MFDYRNFYRLYNARTAAVYEEDRAALSAIAEDTSQKKGGKESRQRFFKSQAQFLITCMDLEEKWDRAYFATASREQLVKDQDILYGDLKRSSYSKTVLNPSFAAKILGREEGVYYSVIAALMRENIGYAYKHMQFAMHRNHALLLGFYELTGQNHRVSADEIRQFLTAQMLNRIEETEGAKLHANFDPSERYRLEMIETLDWSDPLNLYAMGEYVSKSALKLTAYMQTLPEETIDQMAENIVDGYKKGFMRNGKDWLSRKTVGISYPLGMERLIRKLISLFREEMHYLPIIQHVDSGTRNKQYAADHRFDAAAWSDEAYFEESLKVLDKLYDDNHEILGAYGGPVYIELYGEKPYQPKRRAEALRYSEEQTKLLSGYRTKLGQLRMKAMPGQYTSYTIVSYPSPEICDDFEGVFQQTIRINTLDEEVFEQAQQKLIDVLDRGTSVHITGRDGNETDLAVALAPLEDPAHQTGFFNCLADQNIPAGEIFTTPRLTGTNGVLHVKKAYLNGLPYENLKLTFEDGYVKAYSLSSFESEEENQKYVEDNLLFPYDTLPVGEFAIGTNRLAYEMARDHRIEDRMEVLIWEKTGPHLAIGDTCYAHEEDLKVYNTASNKEITSKDNEKSILRKDPERADEAYTGIHIDIVMPYHEVGRITAVMADGSEIALIEDGQFVLHGTEKLNALADIAHAEIAHAEIAHAEIAHADLKKES